MPRTQKKIDPVVFAAHAMKQVKTKSDYSRIVAANKPTDIEAAWATLSSEDQQRISNICNDSPPPDLDAIAIELAACGTLIQLQAVKAEHGEQLVRQAWKLVLPEERMRLKGICQTEQQQAMEPPQPVTMVPAPYHMESQPRPKTRSLFSISDDLEKLNELLDDCGDDAQQQELIQQWFEQLGDERDRKLDGYAALITEMMARAEVRKSEAKRMQELAAADENRARLLKDRLKCFFQTHNITTVETARYRLSLAKNGGKQPLILKDGLSPTDLPEQFQRVSEDV